MTSTVEEAVIYEIKKSGDDGTSSVKIKSALVKKFGYNDVMRTCYSLLNRGVITRKMTRIETGKESFLAYVYKMSK